MPTQDDTATIEIFAISSEIARENAALNLSQGIPEPRMDSWINFFLPESLAGGWQYANSWGTPELRSVIAKVIYNGLFPDSNILVTSGCTESLFIAIQHAAGQSLSVAFFEPFYPYYRSMSDFAGLRNIPIPMLRERNQFLPDWDLLERIFQSGTRLFILNSPHNPTGWVMNDSEARIFRALVDRYEVFTIVDEAYRFYAYDVNDEPALATVTTGNDRVMIAGSFSKMLSASGLRAGWMIADQQLLKKAHLLHMNLTFCQPGPLQALIVSILRMPDFKSILNDTIRHYRRKRDLLMAGLASTGLSCFHPGGGHFLIADYSATGKRMTSHEFAIWFAKTYGVMPLSVTPFFDADTEDPFVRFSFAVPLDTVEQAVARIANKEGLHAIP